MIVSELIRKSGYNTRLLKDNHCNQNAYKSLVDQLCKIQKDFDDSAHIRKFSIYEIENQLFELLELGYHNLTDELKAKCDKLQHQYVTYK